MSRALCTQIKDRLEFLKQTLPTWLEYPFDEIVIFDWFSEEPVEPFVRGIADDRVCYYKLLLDKPYNLSKAKNGALRGATADVIYWIDCDVLITDGFPKDLELPGNFFYQGREIGIDHTFGSGIISRQQVLEVNGYNENLTGYGYEDTDFYKRIMDLGVEKKNLPPGLKHVDHSDERRVRFHVEKDHILSAMKNRLRSAGNKWGAENHQETHIVSRWSTEGYIESMEL